MKNFDCCQGWKIDRLSSLALAGCALLWGCLVIETGLSVSSAADPEPQTAVRLRGVLVDGRHIQTRPETGGHFDGRSLSEFQHVTRDSVAYDSDGWSPLRILTLCTGERLAIRLRNRFSYRIPAAADGRQPENAVLKILVAGQPAQVLLRSIRSIAVPDRVRDVFFSERDSDGTFPRQSVTGKSSKPSAAGDSSASRFVRQEFDLSSAACVLELGVVWPIGGRGVLELQFDNGNGFRLSLVDERIWIRRLGTLPVAIATPSVSIREDGQPSRLRLTLGNAVTLSLGGRVVARGTGSPGSLRAIATGSRDLTASRQQKSVPGRTDPDRTASLPGEASPPVVVSCLVQNRVSPGSRTRFTVTDRIAVEMRDGDVFFGHAVDAGPQHVRLHTQTRQNSWNWSDIRHIEFPQRPLRRFPRITGQICRVQFTREAATEFFGRQPVSAVTAAVSVDQKSVKIEHPIVRTESPAAALELPWASVHRIQPLFSGSYLLIGPEIRHLGNTVQPSFLRPVPDGLKWSIRFPLTEPPAGRAWLSVEASGLQPAAADTLRAWPYRKQLRDGFFTTSLTVNDVLAGPLNRHCRFPAPEGKSVRLRIPIPQGALKPGQNLVELTQRPGPSDPGKFLDCEINRIAIEMEEPKRN